MRHLVLLLAIGCTPTFDSPTGQAALPLTLSVSPLAPSAPVTLTVQGANPGATVYYAVGSLGTWCPAGTAPVCVDLAATPAVLGTATATASGEATLTLTTPGSLTPGDTWYFQAGANPSALMKSQVVSRRVSQPCAFGTELASTDVPGFLYDADRITHDGATVMVSTGTGLLHLDEDLLPTGTTISLPLGGNHGVRFDPVSDRLYVYTTNTSAMVAKVNPYTGTVDVGPVPTGGTTGGGFTDAAGHLHLTNRTSAGAREFDPSLTPLGSWGTGGSALSQDLELSADGKFAYRTFWPTVDGFRFSAPGRPYLGSVSPPAVPGSTFHDMTVGLEGTVYLVDRGGKRIVALAKDGDVLGEFSTAPQEPTSADWNPDAHALYVAFTATSGPSVGKYCGY